MSDVMEIHGWVPAGPLTAADMLRIDLDAPFEVSDGKLEIMTPPSYWHQYSAQRVAHLLEQRYQYVTGDVPIVVGENGRRPDVIALRRSAEELIRDRIKVGSADLAEVVVEVISHDDDTRRDAVAVTRDRETKFREYAEAGIPEYWIIDEVPDDPVDASVEVYHLRGARYAPVLFARLSQLIDGSVTPPTR
jgi:Uma2 family endonuclease